MSTQLIKISEFSSLLGYITYLISLEILGTSMIGELYLSEKNNTS